MLVKPPEIPLNSDKIIDNTIVTSTSTLNIVDSLSEEDTQEQQQIIVKKKRQYKQFLKLLKNGQFTTAIVTAKVLGVTRQTIGEWLNTPKALELMNSKIGEYVQAIEKDRTWKSKAYLLDKITQEDKQPTTAIQVNNVIDTVKSKYNI